MTPSLQQAIKLLQMTKLELEGVVSQELEENPLLELDEDVGAAPGEDPDAPVDTVPPAEEVATTETEITSMSDIDLDAYFNDYLEAQDYSQRQTFEEREAVPLENTLTREPDLYDHLMFQLSLMEAGSRERELCELVIGNLNEDGFLVATIEEIQLLGANEEERRVYRERLAQAVAAPEGGSLEERVELEGTENSARTEAGNEMPQAPDAGALLVPGYARAEVELAITRVQSLDPTGIGQPDLRGCLMYQLKAHGGADSLAYRMLGEHWDAFLKRQFPAIAKALGVPVADLEEPVEEIRALDTRPGRRYGGERASYVQPDAAIIKVGDDYVVQLNDDGLPRLRLSRRYLRMLKQMRRGSGQQEAREFIRDKMRAAIWLMKSLDQRQRTIYKVSESIVRQQRDFLDRGIDHMRPLVLRDVADDIGMHESTVSRVVSNKYIDTPRGLFPMKYFFHSGIDRDYGEDISSLSVKRKIRKLIDAEDSQKPLSDAELMNRLNREGINIARRTVAKYRDELGISSSNERRNLF